MEMMKWYRMNYKLQLQESKHRVPSSYVPTESLFQLVYKVLHDDAPRYLGPLTRVDDLPGRRALRSTNAYRLVVPPVKLSTVGSRAFAVAAPHICNTYTGWRRGVVVSGVRQ